jgi:hypothetical protein
MKFFSTTKKKEINTDEYMTMFVKASGAPPARMGKSVYIRKEHHDRISQIVHVAGNSEITIFDYIDNVLTGHFRDYREEIIESFNEKRLY